MSSYCSFCRQRPEGDIHRIYHDREYGSRIDNDNELFGRLLLEINQAGLSWETILRKRDHFEHAYHGYEIARVAAYGLQDQARLMADPGIIRNRLKVEAAISNAQRILVLQSEFGSFRAWIERHHPQPLSEWVRLFKKTLRFTGGQIVNEFLVSTGYLPGAHDEDCYRFDPPPVD